ncbi:CLUMA_CG018345, isoform A [Clunio marinus]|uniref:CLUMA_CG018345, isoform A n=1 Tax=Clunio marinus TaxID=568069 RepID=A0A1J1J1Q4_9DIPT|nr:CLUMA_CG018345, isoform A [Clunio marinus]
MRSFILRRYIKAASDSVARYKVEALCCSMNLLQSLNTRYHILFLTIILHVVVFSCHKPSMGLIAKIIKQQKKKLRKILHLDNIVLLRATKLSQQEQQKKEFIYL